MSKKIEDFKTIEDEEIEQDHRFRLFSLVLYEDTTSYDFTETFRLLKSMGQWAFIKHQPEKDESKEHIHFILRLRNQKKISKLSELTGVPVQHIKHVKSERAMLRYLIHLDDSDKIQYKIEDVSTSPTYWRTFRKSLDDLESEESIITNIYNCIADQVHISDDRSKILYNLIQYVNSNCYDSIYKRYRQEFIYYLDSSLHQYYSSI